MEDDGRKKYNDVVSGDKYISKERSMKKHPEAER